MRTSCNPSGLIERQGLRLSVLAWLRQPRPMLGQSVIMPNGPQAADAIMCCYRLLTAIVCFVNVVTANLHTFGNRLPLNWAISTVTEKKEPVKCYLIISSSSPAAILDHAFDTGDSTRSGEHAGRVDFGPQCRVLAVSLANPADPGDQSCTIERDP